MSMRHPFCALLVAVFGLVPAVPGVAHHSAIAIFDAGRQITIRGTITKIEWINPHIHMFLNTKDQDGKLTTWKFETFPTNWMRKAGITKDAVWSNAAAGEIVTVHAFPARDASMRLGYLLRITYPDGHFIHVTGNPATIAPTK
jgi:uncharacterized protein DUF6152